MGRDTGVFLHLLVPEGQGNLPVLSPFYIFLPTFPYMGLPLEIPPQLTWSPDHGCPWTDVW